MPYSTGRIADRQWRDYQARRPGTYFAEPEARGLGLDQAYDVQEAVAGLRVATGDAVVGHKVGCTGPGTVAQMGMEGPIAGHLYASEIRRGGDVLDASAFAGLAIEGEMALRLGPDLRPEAAFPVVELHNFVFRGPRRTLVELVANNGLNAGVVLPPGDAWPYPGAAATLTVWVNGRELGSAGPWPLPGGPDASLDWLRGHLARRGRALLPGQVVLAGTALGLYPVRAGDRIAVGLDGVPVTECSVA